MARFAFEGLAGGIERCHAARELPLVDVFVTGCAGELTEMVGYYLCTGHRLVACVALYRQVTPRERKRRFLVICQREACGLEGGSIVALLTAVAPWLACKLAFVLVLVAIHASRELDFEFRRRASRHMTRGTLHLRMRRCKWKAGLGMVCHGKC